MAGTGTGTGTDTAAGMDMGTGMGGTGGTEVVEVITAGTICKKPKPQQHGIGRVCVVAMLTLSVFPSPLSHWERSRERGREAWRAG